MKTKMKSIVLALASAIAASTASANLKWFGEKDGNWWTPGNWWNTNSNAIVSSEFTGDYEFGSIEFGDGINSNPAELHYQELISSHTTINLGGREAKITGDLVSEYYGKVLDGYWHTSYDGGPITLTNGTLTVGKSLAVGCGYADHEAVLQLKDVTLTCEKIELNSSGRRKGRLILDGDTSVTAYWFGCAYNGNEEGCLELNGGTLNIPTFSYVNKTWSYPDTRLCDDNGTTNINMTLVFNGGTLKASLNKLMDKDVTKIEVNGYFDWDTEPSPFVPEWMKVEIGEGGIVIDTDDAAGNPYNLTFAATNVTRAAGVTIDGGLTKKGNGMLTVNEGQVWNGPTKVLGGTLDLNGGTINGPLYLDGTLDLHGGKIGNVLILGGSGKIIDSTKTNEDDVETERPEAYEFNPDMWGRIGQTGSWAITSIKVSGAAAFASPSNSVLKSATAWYDPSDENYVDTDEDAKSVKALKNKSSSGSSMDTKELTENLPSLTTINNHNAIAFSGYAGFVSANSNSVSFDNPKGKSIFAVARLNYENNSSNGVYPIAMCSNNAWNPSGVFSMKLGVNEFTSFYRVKSQVSDVGYTTTEMNVEGDDTIGNDNVSYVMSLRGSDAKDNENHNVFSRIIGLDVDKEEKQGVDLSFDEENPTWGSKDVISYGFINYENGLFSNQGAVGEALAFARCLSDEEAEVVQTYLAHKWVSSSIPATWPLAVGTLTLDGDVDFNGANVTIGNLSGNGSIAGAASLKVTGTITAKAKENSTIAVAGDVDLSGATFAVDAALAESLEYNESVTLLTSTGTITGFVSPGVLTVGSSKFKVRKSGNEITVTRMQPGLMIVFR